MAYGLVFVVFGSWHLWNAVTTERETSAWGWLLIAGTVVGGLLLCGGAYGSPVKTDRPED